MCLDDRGRACPGALAKTRGLDRNLAPAREADALLRAGTLDGRAGRLVVQEYHRQASVRSQRGRERNEHACAVAGEPVGVDRATMPHALERGEDEIENSP